MILKNKKHTLTLFLLLISLVYIIPAYSQDNNNENEVKDTLIPIFELCKSSNDIELSKHVVYRGSDEERKWKDVYDSNNNDELKQVSIIRLRINNYLLNDYKFIKFLEDEQSEGIWYVWEMEFKNEPVIFALLKINDRYAIGDID